MGKEIRVKVDYWNSLNEKEQRFLQENVYQYGITVCKKVIQLARKYIPDSWNDLVNASVYIPDKDINPEYTWIAIKDNKVVGTILCHSKLCRVNEMKNQKLVTVYSNY